MLKINQIEVLKERVGKEPTLRLVLEPNVSQEEPVVKIETRSGGTVCPDCGMELNSPGKQPNMRIHLGPASQTSCVAPIPELLLSALVVDSSKGSSGESSSFDKGSGRELDEKDVRIWMEPRDPKNRHRVVLSIWLS